MEDRIITLEKAKEQIILNFEKKYILRKLLIDKCMAGLHLTKSEVADKSPGGVYNASKCRFGNAIDLMIASGYLEQDENKILSKKKEEKQEVTVEDVKRDNLIENTIMTALQKKPYTKKELFALCRKKMLESGNVNVQIAGADTGRVLSELKRAGKIEEKNGAISLFTPKKQEAAAFDYKKAFEKLSDEELVDHSVGLLEKWLKKSGYKDVVAQNTDGPNDNGIDGVITCKDSLGYNETTILQVKHIAKKEKYIPLCEVREFLGVFAAHPVATKAIFITNAKYHKDTIKFVNSYKTKYFLLLDGNAMIRLAKGCDYKFSKEIFDKSE